MNKHYNKTPFQGENKELSDSYFEGWYYKQVDEYSSNSISFIPGISYNKTHPHSFIQCIIEDYSGEIFTYYFEYEVEDFKATSNPFCVTIKDNVFKEDYIKINIEDNNNSIFGELYYTNLKRLRKSFFEPNIMGYLSYLPKKECNHHIVSVNHKVNGSIIFNDKLISFEKGIGYIEKDWGKSFPSEYIWLQCNKFKYPKDINLTFSYATIPYLNTSFKGFFLTLFVGEKEYRFATYNSSKIKKVIIEDNRFEVYIEKKNIQVKIKAFQNKSKELVSPINGEMKNFIKEGLKGDVEISFFDKKNNIRVNSQGKDAGIEIMMKNT